MAPAGAITLTKQSPPTTLEIASSLRSSQWQTSCVIPYKVAVPAMGVLAMKGPTGPTELV